MSSAPSLASDNNPAREFFVDLKGSLERHPALSHSFLARFAEGNLTLEQISKHAAQHYMYSRYFGRNLAGVVVNVPDERIRSVIIRNLYEESGEPLKARERAVTILLEKGLITADDVAAAYLVLGNRVTHSDVVEVMIARGVVTREDVSGAVSSLADAMAEYTHPALFRRYLRAVGVNEQTFAKTEELPETRMFCSWYASMCRSGQWQEAMGAMGPGTECLVPKLYAPIELGLTRSGLVKPEDFVFWTIHIHGDDAHGDAMNESLYPYLDNPESRAAIARGAKQALDARKIWFDGLERHVFGRTH